MSVPPAARGCHANRLLCSLGPEALAQLQPHIQPMELRAGTVLYEPGARIEHAFFPHDCVVSLLAVLDNSCSAEVALFGREGVVGYVSSHICREAFGRYVVQIPGTASRISLEQLGDAATAMPTLSELLARYTEALLRQTFQIVACNAVHTVGTRCCRWLLSTHDRVNDIALPLSHEFLAEMLGVQRPTVSLIMRSLQSAGFIKQRRGEITIVDREGLQAIACECYGGIRRTYERLLPQPFCQPLERAGAARYSAGKARFPS